MEAVLSGIVVVLFVILLFVLHLARKARAVEQGRDVGVAVFVADPTEDLDEDINAPSVKLIERALAKTTDPHGRDELLDQWIAAKRGEVA